MPCSLASFLLTNITSVLTQHLWLTKTDPNFCRIGFEVMACKCDGNCGHGQLRTN